MITTTSYRTHVKRADPKPQGFAPHVTYDFPSIGAFGDAVRALRDERPDGADKHSENRNDPAWFGNMTLARAIKMAETGGYWAEALADMRPLPIDQARLLEGAELEVPAAHADVQGFTPLVPNFLNGTPDAMLAMHPDPVPNKVLRIGVGIVHLCTASREAIFNRGNAILSIVDALETHAGFSCEIVAVWSSRSRGPDKARVYSNVTIKRADQRWDPAAVAFALCHAAFGRRLGFRWVESQPELTRLTQYNYGTTYDLKDGDYDLVFNAMQSDRGFGSRQEAIDTLLTATVGAIKARKTDSERRSRLVA